MWLSATSGLLLGFAKVGQKLDTGEAPPEPSTPTSTAASSSGPVQGGFKPTRRVRQTPGGLSTLNIFGESDDTPPFPPAARTTSTKVSEPPTSDDVIEEQQPEAPAAAADQAEPLATREAPRPSRRVRELPGGKDSINDIFADRP